MILITINVLPWSVTVHFCLMYFPCSEYLETVAIPKKGHRTHNEMIMTWYDMMLTLHWLVRGNFLAVRKTALSCQSPEPGSGLGYTAPPQTYNQLYHSNILLGHLSHAHSHKKLSVTVLYKDVIIFRLNHNEFTTSQVSQKTCIFWK